MNIPKIIIPIFLLSAACSPNPEIEETVICWTEEVSTTNFEKFQPVPQTICVPISTAPTIPPSILERAYIKTGPRNDRDNSPAPVTSPGSGTTSPPVAEFSTITGNGPVAGQKNTDGDVAYSMIDRERNEVTAVDGDIRTDANQARQLRDVIFKDAGLE